MSTSALNGVRRALAEELDKLPCIKRDILHRTSGRESYENNIRVKDASYRFNISNKLAEKLYRTAGIESFERAYELEHQKGAELMRTKYCIRHELGMCQKAASPLYLLNNGQRFALIFDCRNCEMIVKLA
jgi:putative protease